MRKVMYLLFLALISNILIGCATNKEPTSQYAQNEFNTESYQAVLSKALNLTESLTNFNNIPQIELSPADFAILMRSDISFNQANYADAAPLLVMLSNKYKDPRIIYKSILALNNLLKTKDQQLELKNMINLLYQVEPNSNLVKLLEIKQNLKEDNVIAAELNLDELIKSDPDNARTIFIFLSGDLVDLGKIDESWIQYIITKYGQFPEAHLLASVAYAINNNKQQLNEQIFYIKTTYPTWEVPYYFLSAIFMKTQAWDNITGMFDIVTKYPPELSMLLQNVYVISLLKTNGSAQAQIYLQQTLTKLPSSNNEDIRGNIYLNMAMLELYKQNYTIGLDYLKQAESNGHILNGTTSMLIGAIYDYKANYTEAMLYYKKINEQNVLLSYLSRLSIIQDYLALNDIIVVNLELDKLAKLNKLDDKGAILLKSAFYIDADQYKQSYELLVKNIKHYSNDKDYLYQYAVTLSMLNKTKDAINIYEKCIKLDKQNALAYNDLAYVLVTPTKDISRAKLLAEKALALEPENFAVLDTLAWIYYKQSNYAKAVVYAKQAYSLNQDSEIAGHLKYIYIALGNNEEANKIIIPSKADKIAEFRRFVLDKTLALVIYFQYGIEQKQ